MKRALLAITLAWLGLVAPACESSSGGSDRGPSSEECSAACQRITAADCGDVGANCFDACVRYLDVAAANECSNELASYLGCFWAAEAFTCDADLHTQAVGCEEPLAAYVACSEGGGGGGSAGAGGAGTDEAGAGAGGAPDSPSAAGAAGAQAESG